MFTSTLRLVWLVVSRVVVFVFAVWLVLWMLGAVIGFFVAPLVVGAYGEFVAAVLFALMLLGLHVGLRIPGAPVFDLRPTFVWFARALTFREVA